MSESIIGIDLGTTFSLIGCMQNGRATLIPDINGQILFPSAVFIDEHGAIHTGSRALRQREDQAHRGAIHFKRDMGSGRNLRLGEREFRSEELSAFVLASLKANAEAWLGQSVSKAVISVPAYFGEAQRQATRRAAEIAGLDVLRLVNEPTAAAIAYGMNALGRESRIAVLDLGGGTFDVTMLEICEGVIEIRSSSGDIRLGGLDFDQALADLARQCLGAAIPADNASQAKLVAACELAKKEICAAGKAVLRVEFAKKVELAISAADADAAWDALAERLNAPIIQAIRDCGWDASDIDEVILVGGASRLPVLGRIALARFGKFPVIDPKPDEVVAIGTVMTAGLMADDQALEDLIVTDIAPFTMGIRTVQHESGLFFDNIYSPLIERGTVIPCSRSKVFMPAKPGQTQIELEIFQGEHPNCSHNTRLGTLQIPNVPREENRSQVEVRFTYDLNGLLEVEASILATGDTHAVLVEKSPGSMDENQMQRARLAMSLLKIAPHEERRNAAVLIQAQQSYAGALGSVRERLQYLIVQFELALQSQEPQKIAETRDLLLEFLHGLN